MCAAAAGGVGSDSEFCRNSNPQGAAVCLGGLAVHGSTGCVFISSCPSSFPPERPAETPQAPGGLPTLVTVPQVCITHVPVRAFSQRLPMRTETMAKVNRCLPLPLSPPGRGRPGSRGQTRSWLCALRAQAACTLCGHVTWALHGSQQLQCRAQCREGTRSIRHSPSYPEEVSARPKQVITCGECKGRSDCFSREESGKASWEKWHLKRTSKDKLRCQERTTSIRTL